MFLSCPNTMNKKDPYDTQYAIHVYEWDIHEYETVEKKLDSSFRKSIIYGWESEGF